MLNRIEHVSRCICLKLWPLDLATFSVLPVDNQCWKLTNRLSWDALQISVLSHISNSIPPFYTSLLTHPWLMWIPLALVCNHWLPPIQTWRWLDDRGGLSVWGWPFPADITMCRVDERFLWDNGNDMDSKSSRMSKNKGITFCHHLLTLMPFQIFMTFFCGTQNKILTENVT